MGNYYNCQVQDSSYEVAKVVSMLRNIKSDRYEYNVQLYKCPSNFMKWIPKSNINNKMLTQDELERVCHRTAEEIEQNKRSKIIKKQSDIWNFPSSKPDIYQYLSNTKSKETKDFQKMNQKMQNEVYFGKKCITTDSAFYSDGYNLDPELHVCDTCFKYFKKESLLDNHTRGGCKHSNKVPGKVVFEETVGDKKYTFYEVDEGKENEYCRQLCKVATLWVGSKTVAYKVEEFWFYLLTVKNVEVDRELVVGNFSKIKDFGILSGVEQNLSVILVFPHFARKVFTTWLVDLSNKLSILQKTPRTPETPLSKGGRALYHKYRSTVIAQYLSKQKALNKISIPDISKDTGILEKDVKFTLLRMNILKKNTRPLNMKTFESIIQKYIEKAKRMRLVDREKLAGNWKPHVTHGCQEKQVNAVDGTKVLSELQNPYKHSSRKVINV